jgi:hypothetical protein
MEAERSTALEAVIRQLVTTQSAKDFLCAVVNCKECELAIKQQLLVVAIS